MIIDRYLVREVLATLFGVVAVLLLILLSVRLVRLFAEAAAGNLPVDVILIALGLKSIANLVFILPLALYLAVLLTLIRLHKDSEMAALAACGVGAGRILRPLTWLGLVFAVLTGALGLYVGPWAENQNEKLVALYQESRDVQGVIAGRFIELKGEAGAVYVERFDEDLGEYRNVFFQSQGERGQVIVSSLSAYQRIDERTGDRYLVLENGQRYEGRPGAPDFAIVEFDRHGIRIERKPPREVTFRLKATPTVDLLRSGAASDVAELQWRVSPMLLCLVLTWIAVPLGRTSPRQGHYLRVGIAILIYIVYSNMLNVSRAWLEDDNIPQYVGLWWVHLCMGALALVLFAQQFGWRALRLGRVR
ncbi:MAG: LPS export ABC transporter permease LptF [Pseudomonadota bacterium]|nr:MAG: LPS export ABC transporter permease LptF [Pseudomonadota bacterium]